MPKPSREFTEALEAVDLPGDVKSTLSAFMRIQCGDVSSAQLSDDADATAFFRCVVACHRASIDTQRDILTPEEFEEYCVLAGICPYPDEPNVAEELSIYYEVARLALQVAEFDSVHPTSWS
jgi:hypothetical protein